MSGRNFNASSSMLKYVIFLYFVLLSSNCNAYPSLLTGIKGDNKEKTSVTDALQSIIMRQLTLISECMSQKSSDIRNDVLINKKTSEQTQKELMIMKEEIKLLKEQLSKIKMEMTEYKATTDQTLERQENIITDINLNTKEFKEIYQNNTQELSERVDKQDDKYDKQSKSLIKQENINGRLENEIRALKENYQNKTQELAIQLKEQDDKNYEQSKLLIKQERINRRLIKEIRELKKSHHSLTEKHQNYTQKLVTQLKEQDDKNDQQSKRLITQEKINEKIENEIRELKENHHSLNETLQNDTQKLFIKLKEQDGLIAFQIKSQLEQSKGIEKLEKLFAELNETQNEETEELSIELKNQGTCRDILRDSACRIFNCRSGVYSIYVNDKATPVWCDMETDGGGWTVIQRRQNGNVDFYRTWKEYKIGFGNASDEYWIGNDALHVLTSSKKMKLRVDLQQFNGNKRHATFSTFVVANETNKYRLSLSGYTGDKGINGCFSYNNGDQFSTYDKDNDKWSSGNCAVDRHGGWWYNHCTRSNFNGRYFSSPTRNSNSVHCRDWTGYTYTALKSTTMMVR